MAEYIEREALKQALLEKGFYPAIVKSAIEDAPAADVVETNTAVMVALQFAVELIRFCKRNWGLDPLFDYRDQDELNKYAEYIRYLCGKNQGFELTKEYAELFECGAKMDGKEGTDDGT